MAGELVLYWQAGQSNVVANVWREGSPWTHVATDAAMDDTGHGGVYIGDCTTIKPGDHVIYTQNSNYLIGKIYEEKESIHEWHVAKDGNDSNRGHKKNNAKLTISGVLSDSNLSDGDIIYIWPGTYDECVDLDTEGKGLKLIGKGSREKCIIYANTANEDAVKIEDNCILKNLTLLGGAATKAGVYANGKSNWQIINCHSGGDGNDGLYAFGSTGWSLINSYVESHTDGLACSNCNDYYVENCQFYTDGTLGNVSKAVSGYSLTTNFSRGVFKNCSLRVDVGAGAGNQNNCYAVHAGYGMVFENCSISCRQNNATAGDAYAIHSDAGTTYNGSTVLHNCHLESYSAAGNEYDLYADTNCEIKINNSLFDDGKTGGSGTIKIDEMNLADDAISAGKYDQSTAHPITTAMQKAGSTIITGTISYDNTPASSTVFYSDDITEATADHYNGRIVIFTSGALTGQATDITDYALVSGEGKFTVTALTEAPADNDTFVIV